jgi:hypothetical protein
MAKGDDIEERLVDFAVRIVTLSGHLPNTQAGKHISGQVLRSGAESRKDFVHKLKFV